MSIHPDLQKAHAALNAKDYTTADILARGVLETNPKAHKAYQILSVSAKGQNNWAGAEEAIKAALDIEPNDAECLNSYGNILYQTGRGLEARSALGKALDIAPNYVVPAVTLGQLLLREKDPIEAAELFRAALVHAPGHPSLTMGLLFALKDAQQVEAATALMSQIPPSPETALVRGQIAAMNKQKPVAEANFIAAINHPPTSDMGFRNLVQLGLINQNADAAAARIAEIIKSAPDVGGFYLSGADMLSDMGRRDEGLALLDQCVAKFGVQTEITTMRAKLLIEAGDGASAFELAEAALRERPGDLTIMAHFTRSALMTERFDLALQATKAAQQRQQNNQFWTAIEATALRGLKQDEAFRRLYNYDFVTPYDLETPPEYTTQSEFLSKLTEELAVRQSEGGHPLGQSLRGGTQTTQDLRFADSRVIQDFFQALSAPIMDYINRMPEDAEHPLFRRKTKGYRLTGAWSVRLSGQGFHVNHIHPEGWISSAFYVQVPKGTDTRKDKAGWIKFGEPPFAVPGMSYDHAVGPKAGQLVLFPSYMWHGTIPITDGSTRITLPFDAVPSAKTAR
ncbi:putative 2OG-Fe(II) oxygenase [Fretibacter rubidus]|uniref:putative 2OG-Fe(II) oxygenase n=1 Tax=Fretibacter rubidus TaxID=570162 RepID=UPI00352B12FB